MHRVVVGTEEEAVEGSGHGGTFVFVEIAVGVEFFEFLFFGVGAEVFVFGEKEGGAAEPREGVKKASVAGLGRWVLVLGFWIHNGLFIFWC